MKKSVFVLITSIIVFTLSLVSANAQQTLVESVASGCNDICQNYEPTAMCGFS